MTIERPFHPLDSQILEVASDKANSVEVSVVILEDEVRSRTVEILDCYRLQNIMWISLCIESASNVHNPCFSSERDDPPHHHNAPIKIVTLR